MFWGLDHLWLPGLRYRSCPIFSRQSALDLSEAPTRQQHLGPTHRALYVGDHSMHAPRQQLLAGPGWFDCGWTSGATTTSGHHPRRGSPILHHLVQCRNIGSLLFNTSKMHYGPPIGGPGPNYGHHGAPTGWHSRFSDLGWLHPPPNHPPLNIRGQGSLSHNLLPAGLFCHDGHHSDFWSPPTDWFTQPIERVPSTIYL